MITIVTVEDAAFPHWSVTATVTSYVPTDHVHPVLVVISSDEKIIYSSSLFCIESSVLGSSDDFFYNHLITIKMLKANMQITVAKGKMKGKM